MNQNENIYQCAVISHLNDFQKKEWQYLWDESRTRHIFNSPTFFETCCEAFGYNEFKIIFCRKKGVLCGVLPLVSDRIFGIKVFLCPGRKGNFVDKNAILIRENNNDIFDSLLDKALELGNLYLGELSESEKEMMDCHRFSCVIEKSSRSRWLDLSRDSNVFEAISDGQKRTLLRRIRQRKNDLEFRFFDSNLEKALEIAMEIEKGSYKFRRGMAFFAKKGAKEFIRAVIQRCPQHLRIGILYFFGKPVAAIIGFVCEKTFFGYYTSYLKIHRSWGAGKAAIYLALENLKNGGYTKADLLRGDSYLKQQIAHNCADQYNIYLSNKRIILFWWRFCAALRQILIRMKMLIELIFWKIFRLSGWKIYFLKIRDMIGMPQVKIKKEKKFKIKKSVIFFSSYDNPKNPYYAGGGAASVHEVAKRLVPHFEVHVIAGKYPHCSEREFLDGIHYQYIGSNFFGPKFGHIAYHIMLPLQVMIKKFDIWVESFTPPFSISFLPFFTKKPVVGLVHMLSGEEMRRKYRIPFDLIENIGVKMYDYFIVLTKQTRNKIQKINPKAEIEVIPNGVDTAVDLKNPVKKYLLFIGRIEINQKGLDLLFESYKFIMDKINYPLVIAGQGTPEEEKKLLKLISGANFSEKVKFLGRIENKEKSDIFQGAAAVIIPSRYETFSLVALESLVFGVSIISFDIEGLKWLPQGLAIKVRPFDVSALALAIIKTLEKDSVSAFDRETAKIFLKDYSWGAIADKFENRLSLIMKSKI